KPGEEQGELALLPSFQLGLIVGLWFALSGGRRRIRLVVGLAVIAASQLALLIVAGRLTAGGITPHALFIRGWALAWPIALALAWARTQGTIAGDPTYRRFWNDVGEEFPTLTGAASTDYYRANEKRLLGSAFPTLDGLKILKTDLWDEAKNTQIMQWAADQGAQVYGIDISEPIARQARAAFDGRTIRTTISDVRRLPYTDGSFDAIYSMGTVEHFIETEASVAEMARILKP